MTRSVFVLNLSVGLLRALGGSYFWTLVQFYVFFTLAAIEAGFEPFFGKARWILLVAVIGAAVCFTVLVPLSRAPLGWNAYLHPSDYAPDAEIAGIKWDARFADLRLTVANQTDKDYKSLDVRLMPDQWIYKASILNPTRGCDLTSVDGPGTEVKVTFTTKAGKATATESRTGDVSDTAGNLWEHLAANTYRLRCDTLPSHYTIHIVFAAVSLLNPVNPPAPPPGGMSASVTVVESKSSLLDMLGPKPEPLEIRIEGKFASGIKPFLVEKTAYVGDSTARLGHSGSKCCP